MTNLSFFFFVDVKHLNLSLWNIYLNNNIVQILKIIYSESSGEANALSSPTPLVVYANWVEII